MEYGVPRTKARFAGRPKALRHLALDAAPWLQMQIQKITRPTRPTPPMEDSRVGPAWPAIGRGKLSLPQGCIRKVQSKASAFN